MGHYLQENGRLLLVMFVFTIASSMIALPPKPVAAIDCDGVLTPGDDCTLQEVGAPLTGNYRTVIAGDGTFEDNSSGSVSLTVPNCTSGPATITRATLSWSSRDSNTGFWDDGVNLAVDAGAPTGITEDRRYKADGGGLSYTNYSADVTAQVLAGTHTYDVSGIDTSGTADFSTTQWGFGIHVIYECPEFDTVTIQQMDGLDLHWYGWGAGYNTDRSEVYCETFSPLAVARDASLDIFLPGSAAFNREADIWYSTGVGTPPAGDLTTDVNTGANGGTVLERLAIRSDGLPHDPEWDQYEYDGLSIPAGNEYVCYQIDSSFTAGQHPIDAAASGASMFTGGMWLIMQQPAVPTLSLGDLVWEDANDNGVFDAGESGICDVTLHLYQDVGAAGYSTAEEGTTPLSSTTTACGGSDGQYAFTGLSADQYCVVIPFSEFDTDGTLEGYTSSSGGYEPGIDPENNVNNDDNGTYQDNVGVSACGVILAINSEPTNDGDADTNTNYSVDFGVVLASQLAATGDTTVAVISLGAIISIVSLALHLKSTRHFRKNR